MSQFHFFPRFYLRMIRHAIPAYDQLQDEVARATRRTTVRSALDLGTGTGETALRVLRLHDSATMVCLDRSAGLLKLARKRLPAERVSFYRHNLEEPFPIQRSGLQLFDVITSALAIHHLDSEGKRLLFLRIAQTLSPRGLFVMADVVIPGDPNQAITPLDYRHDHPSRLEDQLMWMHDCGLEPTVQWHDHDLAVIVAGREKA